MRFRLLCAALFLCLAATAQPMSVEKLITFLKSSVEMKHSDSEVAKFLKNVKLTDKLTDRMIEDLLAIGIGPKTRDALNVLRDRSANLGAAVIAPPKDEGPKLPPVPSSAEQAEIIRDVREYALSYTKGLPDFVCTQVTRRKAAGEPGSRYAMRGANEPSFQTQDTLTIRLSYFEQKEDYKLILHNNSPTTEDYQKLGGATSSGEFGSMMREIFEPYTQTYFEWDHWATLRGKLVMAFRYNVEQPHSQWGIDYEHRQHIYPAYSGLIFIDKDLHVVLRITLNADNIPPTFPIRLAKTILDYDYQDISGHEFLLPLKAQVDMSADGILTRNETEFRLYRKYSAESEIKYDITPDPLPDDKTKEAPAVDCKDPKNASNPACKKK
ncbi:MAG TPA: hypothetical protein VMJ75_30400 [Candidatus Acidoferrales bacterium]|nr:hypothetical protein [Candidatus Acidoferrales bacterium]